MPSKMSGHLYHEVDCSSFYCIIFYPQPIFFKYICTKIGHQANPGWSALPFLYLYKKLTVSPAGGTVLS